MFERYGWFVPVCFIVIELAYHTLLKPNIEPISQEFAKKTVQTQR